MPSKKNQSCSVKIQADSPEKMYIFAHVKATVGQVNIFSPKEGHGHVKPWSFPAVAGP